MSEQNIEEVVEKEETEEVKEPEIDEKDAKIEELTAKVEELEGKVNILKNEYARAYADTENMKKRLQNQFEQSVEKNTGVLRPIEIVTIIWVAGMVLLLGYTAISFLRLKRKVAISVRKTEEVWVCDAIHSPFVLGIFKSRVYLPSYVEEEQA